MELRGDWTTQDSLAPSRREYQRLLTQYRQPKTKRKRKSGSEAAPEEEEEKKVERVFRPRFIDLSSSSEESLDDSDDEDRKDFLLPDHEQLIPVADWYRSVDDGLQIEDPKPDKDGRAPERWQSVEHYRDVLTDHMRRWVSTTLPSLAQSTVDRLAALCYTIWIQVHSAPAWERQTESYSVPYHVLCCLSEMRCDGGLRIRIARLCDYNTRLLYEGKELDYVTAIAYDDDVAAVMPLKSKLAKMFAVIKAVDTRDRRAVTSVPKGGKRKGFVWDNRCFGRCQTVLRSCLFDWHRISYHTERKQRLGL